MPARRCRARCPVWYVTWSAAASTSGNESGIGNTCEARASVVSVNPPGPKSGGSCSAQNCLRGLGRTHYRNNLRKIFGQLKDLGLLPGKVWVIPQPDWSQHPAATDYGDKDALHAEIALMNGILAEEAKAVGATYVDLYPLMVDQAKDKQVAKDGLHPSAAAYDAWAEQLSQRPLPQ